MKKIIFSFLLFIFCKNIFCQDVIISGYNKNRPLIWKDFTGVPDNNSSFEANTYWNIAYNITGVNFLGDSVSVSGFSVTLKLNNNLSWVKPNSQTDYLLNHEQKHFDIALLCQKEIIAKLKNAMLPKNKFKELLPQLFSSTLEKYKQLETQYDNETDHSKNKDKQAYWNNLITTALSK